jgi:hypothetical protein
VKTYKVCPTSPPITIMQGVVVSGKKRLHVLERFHVVVVAARSRNAHLVPVDKPASGVDAALCAVRPLMLGWQPAGKQFLCSVCVRLAD